MRLLWLLFAIVALQIPVWSTCAEQPIPALHSRVTDTAGILTTLQAAEIEKKLANLEETKGSQVVLLIVPTIEPEAIEQYSLRVAELWKLGRKGVNDGVLFIVALKERQMRIEVGYGLEGALNDATCKRIIDETVKPYFRSGDYAGGLLAGVEHIAKVISGEPLPPPSSLSPESNPAMGHLILIFFGALILGSALRTTLGRPLSASLSGGAVIAAGFVMTVLFPAVIMAIFVFLLVLAGTASGGRSIGRTSGGWGGSSSRSSGGGFSGGGGSFGGGGASGSW